MADVIHFPGHIRRQLLEQSREQRLVELERMWRHTQTNQDSERFIQALRNLRPYERQIPRGEK